ncbi:SRPBCC family protein [Kitasatospora sp. NBC_01250]|uniref:SRPBCC family protein n=1 Tax=unclassified Kitasatospora TaxID=2633591 RepID=UPI002E146442|nr:MULTISPECIES: SRPBCC family protein [unclassified Kitasatospora]WSJ65679.1 SRPBCC family protein [Kitasatospora sp. NBC_01302]
MNDLGTLEPAGDRWRLRFTRDLAHAPERVWRALTEPEHLAAWFPHRISGEWRVGATLTFTDPLDRAPAFEGRVLACVPPTLLEFEWGTDVIRLELTERAGGCTLVLLDTLDERGKAARDGAGWHECLDRLAAALDGTDGSGPGWAELNKRYVAALGPGASTIGPPPGY